MSATERTNYVLTPVHALVPGCVIATFDPLSGEFISRTVASARPALAGPLRIDLRFKDGGTGLLVPLHAQVMVLAPAPPVHVQRPASIDTSWEHGPEEPYAIPEIPAGPGPDLTANVTLRHGVYVVLSSPQGRLYFDYPAARELYRQIGQRLSVLESTGRSLTS